jgi:hypothetical protein
MNIIWIFFIIVISSIIFFSGVIFIASDLSFSFDLSDAVKLDIIAKIGDSFNILTSFITSLTFAGLIWSIFIQQKELKGMQQEMQRSNFDNQFFQLLNVSYKTTETLNKNDETSFKHLLKIFVKSISFPIKNNNNKKNPIPTLEDYNFKKQLTAFSQEHSNSMQYFFLNLYQIIKYINDSSLEAGTKKRYSNILRAQLSMEQLALLFYNGFGLSSDSKYMDYINEYSLLEHLNYKSLSDVLKNSEKDEKVSHEHIDNQIILRYDKNAFGENKVFKQIIKDLIDKKETMNEQEWYTMDTMV